MHTQHARTCKVAVEGGGRGQRPDRHHGAGGSSDLHELRVHQSEGVALYIAGHCLPKEAGPVAHDAAAARRSSAARGVSLAVGGFTVGGCEMEAKWCIVRHSLVELRRPKHALRKLNVRHRKIISYFLVNFTEHNEF